MDLKGTCPRITTMSSITPTSNHRHPHNNNLIPIAEVVTRWIRCFSMVLPGNQRMQRMKCSGGLVGWLRLNIRCLPQTPKIYPLDLVANLLINGQEAPTYIARHPILISRGHQVVEVSLWSRFRTVWETSPSSNQYINLKFNHFLRNHNQSSPMLMRQVLFLVQEVYRCLALGQTKTLRGQATRPQRLIVYLEEVCMRTPRKKTSSDVGVVG